MTDCEALNLWHDAADNSKRSFDTAVGTLRAEFVAKMAELKTEALKRVNAAILRSRFGPGEAWHEIAAAAAVKEMLDWLSEADLPAPVLCSPSIRYGVTLMRDEFMALPSDGVGK